jgi:hypothetical protein
VNGKLKNLTFCSSLGVKRSLRASRCFSWSTESLSVPATKSITGWGLTKAVTAVSETGKRDAFFRCTASHEKRFERLTEDTGPESSNSNDVRFEMDGI